MAGLLTRYLDNRRADQQAEEYRAGLMELIGQPQQAQSQATGLLGGDQPMQVDAQISQPTGLLGGQMTPQQFRLQQEALGSGIWGEDFARPMAQQRMMGEQAMERQQTLSPYQAGQLTIQQQNQLLAQSKDARDFVTKENAAYRDTVQNVQNLNNSMPMHDNGAINWAEVENNGAVQHDIVMTYAKTILPGEAVMSDDKGNIVLATTDAPDFLKGIISSFNSGQLGPDALRQLFMHTQKRAASMDAQMRQVRQWGQRRGADLLPEVGYSDPRSSNVGPAGNPGRYTQVQD